MQSPKNESSSDDLKSTNRHANLNITELSHHLKMILEKIIKAYSEQLNTAYRSSDTVKREFFILKLKVIKEEFKKLESLKIGDGSFACDTSLEIFHKEFNRARGDDEVELTDKESSDSNDKDEVAKIFRIDTNVFDFETPIWKDDGYCNGGNFPGAYIVGNTLRYQDLEWYEALKDSKLKEEALKNKAIMEGIFDEYDESSNEGWRRWDERRYNHDNNECEYEMEHEDEERCELFDDQKWSVCDIRRFKMIKYSFGDDEKCVAIK
ncbi:hypothetical protein Tco_1337425 [Tanacetum coccineum]